MQFTLADLEWLRRHARPDGSTWVCKTSGANITASVVIRKIPARGEGDDAYLQVGHLSCSACDERTKVPPPYSNVDAGILRDFAGIPLEARQAA